MTYDLDYHPKPAFLDDLIDLPKDWQNLVGQAIIDLTGDPVTPAATSIKKAGRL